MEKVLLNLALILVTTKFGGLLSRKAKMPEVLGALLAGVIIGPVCLNLVNYDSNIKLLANLGVIFLMFLAGLETDLEQFKKAGKSSFVIALFGILVPLILGTLSAFLFYSNVIENIFVGIILTATSVSITVETLTELGKLNTTSGINILGAAVIDDILGIILVSALLSVNNSSGGEASLVKSMLEILLFCAVGILAILFAPKLIQRIKNIIHPSQTYFTIALAAVLLIAFAAEDLGIAAITGAYLCGLLLSQFPHKEYLQRNVKAVSSGFLSPIFFASVGLEASLSGFSSREVLITLIMFVIAVFGKVVGCGAGARIFGISKRESLQIGVGMVSRGEVAIITANIGLQAKIISQEIFIPTILVVLLTTIVTPILLKLTFTRHHTHKIDSRS